MHVVVFYDWSVVGWLHKYCTLLCSYHIESMGILAFWGRDVGGETNV